MKTDIKEVAYSHSSVNYHEYKIGERSVLGTDFIEFHYNPETFSYEIYTYLESYFDYLECVELPASYYERYKHPVNQEEKEEINFYNYHNQIARKENKIAEIEIHIMQEKAIKKQNL